MSLENEGLRNMIFKVTKTTKMGKLMMAYYQSCGVPYGSYRFLFDERRIQEDDTLKKLEMENDDVIDVYPPQSAGALMVSGRSE